MDEPNVSEQDLEQLVKDHKVCWEVWPLRHVDPDTGLRTIGYQLELMGTHHEPEHPPNPGCEECSKVYAALRTIARTILPKEERDSTYQVRLFDHAMRFSPRRGFRKDVQLVLTIQHRTDYTEPIDACETQCLREMEQNLKRLGARKHTW